MCQHFTSEVHVQARGVVDGCELWRCFRRGRPRQFEGRCSPEEPSQPFIHSSSLCLNGCKAEWLADTSKLTHYSSINVKLNLHELEMMLPTASGLARTLGGHTPLCPVPAVLFRGDFSVKYSLSKAGIMCCIFNLKISYLKIMWKWRILLKLKLSIHVWKFQILP